MRALFMELLHKGKIDNWPKPPTEDELEDFESFEDPEEGPTFEKFRLDFSHKPLRRSIWNKRAADVAFTMNVRLT